MRIIYHRQREKFVRRAHSDIDSFLVLKKYNGTRRYTLKSYKRVSKAISLRKPTNFGQPTSVDAVPIYSRSRLFYERGRPRPKAMTSDLRDRRIRFRCSARNAISLTPVRELRKSEKKIAVFSVLI